MSQIFQLSVLYFHLLNLATLPKRWMIAKKMHDRDPMPALHRSTSNSFYRKRNSALTVSAPVLTDSIFPTQQLQKGIKVAVDRFEAAPNVPKAPV